MSHSRGDEGGGEAAAWKRSEGSLPVRRSVFSQRSRGQLRMRAADGCGKETDRDGEGGGTSCLPVFIRHKETQKRKSWTGPVPLNGRGSPERAGSLQMHPGFPEPGMAFPTHSLLFLTEEVRLVLDGTEP